MSMLASFFDIRKKSRSLFEGLKISKNEEICDRWMNQYPVLYLSLKDVDGTSFANAYGLLKFTIAQFCDEHAYLEESKRVTAAQKTAFNYVRDAQRNPGSQPTGYWKNTSDNAIIRSFIDYAGSSITMKQVRCYGIAFYKKRCLVSQDNDRI